MSKRDRLTMQSAAIATGCAEDCALSRRAMLLGGASAASLALWSFMPKAALAGTRDPRFLFVILRGGLDGLSLIAPVGDPAYAGLRGPIAIPKAGMGEGFALDGMFALNPNMPSLAALYKAREAIGFHAIHTPYRERSHFDGQDLLESGLANVAPSESGWLNRALAGLPKADKVGPQKGLAMGAVVPLVMRGEAPVLSWIPKTYGIPVVNDTAMRLIDLYNHGDPLLAMALQEGLAAEKAQAQPAAMTGPKPAANAMAMGQNGQPPPNPTQYREFTEAAQIAAQYLSEPGGPRIGALAYNGWDTHANEGVIQGQLGNRLTGLDMALQTLKENLGPAWKDTVVVVATEFGRTARVNGTQGTDHGMATAALMIGGAVKGGRMIADWPGLDEKSLYQNRDLKPTKDLRAVLKGILRDHIGIPPGALASKVFPDSGMVAPMDGLIG